jgi:hypothetical protein
VKSIRANSEDEYETISLNKSAFGPASYKEVSSNSILQNSYLNQQKLNTSPELNVSRSPKYNSRPKAEALGFPKELGPQK